MSYTQEDGQFTTWKQTIFACIIGLTLGLIGACNLHAESRPVSQAGHTLQIEMDAYVDGYLTELGFDYNTLQWSALVLPVLEGSRAAIVYHWHLPAKQPGSTLLAMFTFHEKYIQSLPPIDRRVIAAHEVGHVTKKCDDMRRPHPSMADETFFLLTTLRESCADMVASRLTTPEETLATLRRLKREIAPDNTVLDIRIAVMVRIMEMEKQNVE